MKTTYKLKNADYYGNARIDLVDKIDFHDVRKVIDVGCGDGNTLKYIKSNYKNVTTTGIEPYAESLVNDGVDNFYKSTIEDFLENKITENYDLIMCLDVLEHIWDYKKTLKKLTNHLNDSGSLLISVPNVSNFRVFYEIFLKHNFPKNKDGIFDETHCRWFTKKVLSNDLVELGFKDIQFSFTGMETGKKLYFLNLITFGIFKKYLGFQIIAIARK